MPAATESKVTIRTATEADAAALAEIKSRAWAGADSSSWKRRWRWQFMEHPSRANETTFVVAELSGRVIGGIGWIPARLDTGHDVRAAAFACDIFVDPEIQRSGAGRALVAEIPRHVPLTVWAGASPTMISVYTKLGYPRLAPASLMLLPLDPGALLRARLPGAGGRMLSTLAAPLGLAIRRWASHHALPYGIDLDSAAPFDAAWDRSLERRRRPGLASAVKDAGYMRWRYVDSPLGPYGFVTARRGAEIVGTVVYRVREGSPSLGVLLEVIVDPSLSNLDKSLIAEAIRRMRERGVAAVKVLPTAPELRTALRSVGFLPTPRTPHIFLTSDSSREAGLSPDSRLWDLSLGDGDLDFA